MGAGQVCQIVSEHCKPGSEKQERKFPGKHDSPKEPRVRKRVSLNLEITGRAELG